ncbi:hypothetical protein AVEN_195246-1 [Araneus ventricosus]|uniref:Uncharacterized protein n=1 Tax=Araneus ventricosus TaxID=182803 RepID=A0A4Y2WCR2_ARAVE|nr:hypothetical protein AVEN_195246-1 [Araneus ventricosus]
MKYIPFISMTLDLLLGKKGRKKKNSYTQKNAKIDHSFPNAKRKVNFDFYLRVGGSRVHSCLIGADLDSDKEAADMSCDHQQMKISAQQTLGKMDDIISHSSSTTDNLLRDLLFSKKKNKIGGELSHKRSKKLQNMYLFKEGVECKISKTN